MKLRVVWVGKTKNPQMAKLCADYVERIEHFLPLEFAEVKEGRILAALDPSDRVLALDPEGKSWTSEQFARFVEQHMTSDPRRLAFVIGDYGGLSDEVKKRADVQWSLSPLTFTHDMTRVLLLEQIYRALSIIRNIPYSK
ncbi:MAG TPA: 23S rRNA (pseudouridine(1915)-N(3))-methyltransferase RlmH [Terriglobia bacterium]|nr:23S rRNA (pseudouridine(1915)-N(3))-methyltransferase RlmH [Terriglobia bacterium]